MTNYGYSSVGTAPGTVEQETPFATVNVDSETSSGCLTESKRKLPSRSDVQVLLQKISLLLQQTSLSSPQLPIVPPLNATAPKVYKVCKAIASERCTPIQHFLNKEPFISAR